MIWYFYNNFPGAAGISDPELPPPPAAAGASSGSLDAAAALWGAAEEDASPIEGSAALEPLGASVSASLGVAALSADDLVSGVSGATEPVDVLAATEAPDGDAVSSGAALDVDLLDVLSASALTVLLE